MRTGKWLLFAELTYASLKGIIEFLSASSIFTATVDGTLLDDVPSGTNVASLTSPNPPAPRRRGCISIRSLGI